MTYPEKDRPVHGTLPKHKAVKVYERVLARAVYLKEKGRIKEATAFDAIHYCLVERMHTISYSSGVLDIGHQTVVRYAKALGIKQPGGKPGLPPIVINPDKKQHKKGG